MSCDDLRMALDTIPTLAWCNLVNGCNEFVNKRWCEYTGLSPEKAHGWGWKTAVHAEDLLKLMEKWQAFSDSEKTRECEARLRRSDGAFRWFSLQWEPLRDEAGTLVRWYGIAIDIEDRKRTELLRAAEMLALHMITEGAALTDILNHVCTSIDLHIAPSITSILLMDPDGKRLWPSAGSGVPHDWALAITPLPVAPDTGLCGTAAFLKTRVIVPDVATEPVWREDLRAVALKNGIRAAWSQPILTNDNQVLGTFAIYSAESRVPTGEDLALVEAAARITLIAIERRRSQEAIKNGLNEIRKSEEELRRMTDAIPQTIVVLDSNGTTLHANQATLEYTGFTINDILAPGFRERIFHPDDIERVRDSRKLGLERGLPFALEQRALRRDGQYRWFLIQYQPFRDEQGVLLRWYATGTDIHDRKRIEDRTRNENTALREEIVRSSMFEEIVGSSGALREVLDQVAKVAPTDSTVLIRGEPGTGKELIARAVHNGSKRSNGAFIRANCAAIAPGLFASELFGHEQGAFTGAFQSRLGRIESADGGTVLLKEVGELPADTQAALLRVLQDQEVERVGGNLPIRVDVRVLVATSKDLEDAVQEGTFRRDLFYRLNVFPIYLPPLRQRPGDIPLLVEYLVERYARKAAKNIRAISKETLALFQNYQWPGNIRELQNVVERAVILCDGETLSVNASWLAGATSGWSSTAATLIADLAKREKSIIEAALREAQGKISGPAGAAARLGVPRQTLESKIKRLGIKRYRFKTS